MEEKGQEPKPAEPLPVVSYESADGPVVPRRKWVYGVVAIYLLLMAAVWGFPVLWAMGDSSMDDLRVISCFVTVLSACGLGLIYIPVRIVRRRPISRRSIWIPIFSAACLAAGLIFGAELAMDELFKAGKWMETAMYISMIGVWIVWGVIFGLIALKRGPESVGMKLHRWLIAGSVLELLVAVPAHIIVRRRNECCAGIGTGIAICLGVGIALISFGPSVLFLYFMRRKQIRIEG